MKPLPAVGLASSIIQIIDFSVKITSQDNVIHQPADGEPIDNSTILQNAANNLFRLSLNIDQNDLKRMSTDPKRPKLSDAAEEMLKLSDETKTLTTTLINAVLQAQARGSFADPKWQTVREALSTVWKKKEITGIKKKFRDVRKDVDIALMVALRQYLDQSAETGLPVFSEEDGRIHHVEKWQNDAMDAIHTNDWKSKNKKNVEEFSKLVDKLSQAEREAVFCADVFDAIQFPAMNDRLQSIEPAYPGTLEWSIKDYGDGEDRFLSWLGEKSGQNLFWVTGQPGSGKSTWMKHWFRNSKSFESLERWSGASPGIIAGFSFWDCGTELQNSSEGLLRSLLFESLQDMIHGPLQRDPAIVQWLFAERWEQFAAFGGGMQPLTFGDLRRAFELMISDITKKFFFMVDGLDELEGYPEALISLLETVTKRDNVKIVVSSRGSPAFRGAFQDRPSFELDLYTKGDIEVYLKSVFEQDEKWVGICSEALSGTPERDVIGRMVKKADGNFLWASLAVSFVLQDTYEPPDLMTFRERVDALPPDLDNLLQHILSSLESTDLEHAARLFSLVDAHGYPDILELSFAFDPNTRSGITAEHRPLRESEVTQRVDHMHSLLSNQCRDFLAVFEASESTDDGRHGKLKEKQLKVTYAHKCFKDFIHSQRIQEQILHITGNGYFESDECWANSRLWALKTARLERGPMGKTHIAIWEELAWCIEYALRLQEKDNKVRTTYLDEVGFAAIIEHQENIRNDETDLPEGMQAESFLDIAVWLNLAGYVTIKAKGAERKANKHAVEYYRTMRKRLGPGGEMKWIGGKRCLTTAYNTTNPEIFQLLDYYAKPLRFATPKPFVEIPAGV
ncbi:hypothetical protein BU24DRAFT_422561 [Aaosphaeria arxii CBS 175.79]|uniref:NACHT domain-containing protein n=1 Tax=Aaosphaeria arxii CBS 175.79 TaxID=1450172 RepID=A0A6A5XU86_9PLEO|nr:uncharacterized protein BU24DRAFT_422561 [Aaosphaeria arxii CBS 175.79]KAF2016210.1 hypothetical protein BU24DRAFT_422561 [Aaosphaeria arxii CBS 175.79]